MAYTQSNTDPVSVNGMYLKMYTDIIRDISDDLKEGGNVKSFNLHSHLLRATVIRRALQDDIDSDIQATNEKIESGLYGDLGKEQASYIRGFCIVSAAMKFIGDAFHIIQNDSASLADITDDKLMIELEKHMMYQSVRYKFAKNPIKLQEMEQKIIEGSIKSMKELNAAIETPETVPQDDDATQGELTGEAVYESSE